MLAPIVTILAALVASSTACQPASGFRMTFYGYADNSPPSNQVAINCGGRGYKAAGTGTYEDPLTMAAVKGRFSDCEIVYAPYLKKYLRYEDTCANCHGDWVDVWTGSPNENAGSALLKCENTLTGSDASNHVIISTPPAGLEVNSAELFAAGKCATENVFAANSANTSCVGGTAVSAPAASVPSSPATAASAKPSSKHSRKHRHSHKRI